MGGLSSLWGGTPSSSTQTVSTWTAPQYSFTEPRNQLVSDFVSQNIQRMNEGKYPTYYQNALPSLREQMAQPLRENTFGTPGYRSQSLMGQAGEEGAMYNLGAGSTVARKRKVMSDYATKNAAIDQYLTQLGVNIMSNEATTLPQISNQMAQGPTSQPVTLTSNTGGTQGISGAVGSFLGSGGMQSIPWSSLGNMFGGGGTSIGGTGAGNSMGWNTADQGGYGTSQYGGAQNYGDYFSNQINSGNNWNYSTGSF